jgi:formylglycine-generating enzyme required for sulfatase activity
VTKISWNQAAAFCNWLSERDGLGPEEFCYERSHGGQDWVPVKWWYFRRGYRLPRLEEFRRVHAAGAETSFACGRPHPLLLSRYAVFQRSAAEEDANAPKLAHGGTRKPNDWGFFDLDGNAREYTHDRSYGDTREAGTRVVVGSSYLHTGAQALSRSTIFVNQNHNNNQMNGFRVVRRTP